MRAGKNPYKINKEIAPPTKVTIGILNSIPHLSGYYREVWDVFQLCLASIRANTTGVEYELLVVDNGSCPEVRAYLQKELGNGAIDYLILNKRNIGRPNGVRQVLRSATGDIVVYADGDIYFKLGWLQAQIQVLETYPNAGVVGALPVRHLRNYYTEATDRWVTENADQIIKEDGDLIPESWILDYANSLGYDNTEDTLNEWRQMTDTRITYKELPAYVGSSHMQFMMPRQMIQQLPHQRFTQATGLNREIMDAIVDELGFLRLSTAEPFVHHMGNVLQEEWLIEQAQKLLATTSKQTKPTKKKHWFWGRWRVRQVIKKIHNWTFKEIYG